MPSPSGDCRLQVAALCWRRAPLPEVLLVTSLRTRRWILPKGWPQEGLTLAESAAAEAFEEAGVRGDISATPLGAYRYIKAKDGIGHPCRVEVFSLRVTREERVWAEQAARRRLWLPFSEAARRIGEPDLRHLLLAFGKLRRAA